MEDKKLLMHFTDWYKDNKSRVYLYSSEFLVSTYMESKEYVMHVNGLGPEDMQNDLKYPPE